MRHCRYWILVALALGLFVRPNLGCGPDFAVASFVLPVGPDGDYAHYAAGRLGVLQPGYHTRDLVVAYDWLSGRPLAATEQQAAVATNRHFAPAEGTDSVESGDDAGGAASTALQGWVAARAAIGPVDGFVPASTLASDRSTGNYSQFANCLDDSFRSATQALKLRAASYGAHSLPVVEWVRGQDAVYSNCGDAQPPQDVALGHGVPSLPHRLPAAAPADAPLWLRQDRAYQLAAAQLYAQQFDAALAGFRAIAADKASPWSTLSRYLVARVLVRRASIPVDTDLFNTNQASAEPGRAKPSAARALYLDQLRQAQQELVTMRAEPRMAALLPAIDGLLDYVTLRCDPNAQAITLARRLHGPPSSRFGQALIDLTWLRDAPYGEQRASLPPATIHADPTGLLPWIDVLDRRDEAGAVAQWRATASTPAQAAWLVAALTLATPSSPELAGLLRAAAAVDAGSPAYVAVTYHRLRLEPRSAATRGALLAVLPGIERAQDGSTVNLYLGLEGTTAPTLEGFLAAAPRVPIDPDLPATPQENICGHKVATTSLFDSDAAFTLNRQLPLRLLATAAESSTLPENLRYQVAQAALVRAVMLDRPEIARRMAPLLEACRAAWTPVLSAYTAASTADARHVAGLLALLRFASTEPSVRFGFERRGLFASYDDYRQNWWCTTVPTIGHGIDDEADLAAGAANDSPAPNAQPAAPPAPPLFLTAADRTEAAGEVAVLAAVPRASAYFGDEALAWWRLHPQDPQTPELLGQADRVLRNSCRSYDDKQPGGTHALAHQLFDVLHRDYPQSAWARRYTTWE